MSIKLRQSGSGYRNIVQDGQIVGSLSVVDGVALVYFKGQFAARFKYAKPTTKAKGFIRFVCKNIGVNQYLAELYAEDRPTPLDVCKRYGQLDF